MPVIDTIPGARVEIHGVCQDTVDALSHWLLARVGRNVSIHYYPFRGIGIEKAVSPDLVPWFPERSAPDGPPHVDA